MEVGDDLAQVSGIKAGPEELIPESDQNGSGNEFSRYVYAIGTPCGRFGDAKLGRVSKESVLDPSAWRYYVAGQNPEHSWTQNRQVTSIIADRLDCLTFHATNVDGRSMQNVLQAGMRSVANSEQRKY